MSLLEALAEDSQGQRLTDLCIRTSISTSTAHRILTTLEKRRFVHFDPSDRLWHVGRQAFSIGAAFLRRRNFVGEALPYLRTLRDRTQETASLGATDDGGIVVLAQIESRQIVRAVAPAGGTVPIMSSGLGKAILATYTEKDVMAAIRRHGMKRTTPKTFNRPGALNAALSCIRKDGYAIDDEEAMIGLRCVAAVVYDDWGEALASISVSGSKGRFSEERIPLLGSLVQQTAFDLTRALGGKLPKRASRPARL